MADPKTIRILVDEPVDIEQREAFPGHRYGRAISRSIGFSVNDLQARLDSALGKVFTLVSNCTLSQGDLLVDEVNFSFGIDASGKINLLSLAGGSIGAMSCIQFKIKRRSDISA